MFSTSYEAIFAVYILAKAWRDQRFFFFLIFELGGLRIQTIACGWVAIVHFTDWTRVLLHTDLLFLQNWEKGLILSGLLYHHIEFARYIYISFIHTLYTALFGLKYICIMSLFVLQWGWLLQMFMTCLCILAVDFRIFPRENAKTETYGTSVVSIYKYYRISLQCFCHHRHHLTEVVRVKTSK